MIASIKDFIIFYNQQRIDFFKTQITNSKIKLEDFANFDSKKSHGIVDKK